MFHDYIKNHKTLILFSAITTFIFLIFYISYLGKDRVLKGPYRYIVYPFQKGLGNLQQKITFYKNTKNEIKKLSIFGKEAITFKSQRDGSEWIMHTDLIVEMFIEEENPKYGTMNRIETLEV